MTNFRFLFIFLFLTIFIVSCSPVQIIEDREEQSFPSKIELNETEGLFLDMDRFSMESASSPSPALKTKPFPTTRNNSVNYWINYYSKGKGKKTKVKNLERLGRYGNYMGDILKEKGLPPELIYVAMVESGLNAHVRSTAGAVGYWQFIPSTARLYNLKINSQTDERKDFMLSTQAASNYYKDLYNQFKDWSLSMASYNCGGSCVSKAIKRHGAHNFWTLAGRKALPRETRSYVPKIIAMSHIGRDFKFYGFYNINYEAPLEYELFQLEGGSHQHLSSLSRQLNVALEDLKRLNPQYKTDHVASTDYYIKIPKQF